MFKKNTASDITGALTSGTTIIASGTVFTGNLLCKHALRVDGEINGDIQCSEKLIVGPEGKVNGDISSGQVIIMGSVTGDVHATESFVLKSKGKVNGNVKTRMLTMEPEAVFNGNCNMEANEPFISIERKQPLLNGKLRSVELIN
jgi:cytoskeletal protein CcmA (bactofilin family)